jgi:hypothetical protein
LCLGRYLSDPTAIPYYDFYYFDPYGALFGKRQCEINKYVNYMVITTIPFKITPPANDPNAVNNSQSEPNEGGGGGE